MGGSSSTLSPVKGFETSRGLHVGDEIAQLVVDMTAELLPDDHVDDR